MGLLQVCIVTQLIKGHHQVLRLNAAIAILVKLLENRHELLLCLLCFVQSLDHQANEFIEIYFTIIIIVNFCNELVDNFLRWGFTKTLHHFSDLIVTDRAVTCLVEDIEDFTKLCDCIFR